MNHKQLNGKYSLWTHSIQMHLFSFSKNNCFKQFHNCTKDPNPHSGFVKNLIFGLQCPNFLSEISCFLVRASRFPEVLSEQKKNNEQNSAHTLGTHIVRFIVYLNCPLCNSPLQLVCFWFPENIKWTKLKRGWGVWSCFLRRRSH